MAFKPGNKKKDDRNKNRNLFVRIFQELFHLCGKSIISLTGNFIKLNGFVNIFFPLP